MILSAFEGLRPYWGDIHNHCSVGYGHGSLADSFRNARLQLDFAAVTVHAHWPDMPVGDDRLTDVVAYHQAGFRRSREQWPAVREMVEAQYEPGRFVSYLAFEWHSRKFGDHNIYFNGSEGDIIYAADLAEMRAALRAYRQRGIETMLLPHHIGYKQGYRGINWGAFTSEFSPVVEIMSMHGAAESDSAPYPYLHTMGPRDAGSLYQSGLAQGHIVGVMGSTDHHSAHPGSYGHGRLGVWAESLDRDAIWQAIQARRTVALTGDNIRVQLAVNGQPIGSVLPPVAEREIEVLVQGGGALDYVELLHNNQVIHRWSLPVNTPDTEGPLKVHLEVGWGEKGVNVDWDVVLRIDGGEILTVEPRFRGHEIVAPQAGEEERYAFSSLSRPSAREVQFATRTWGNATTTTAATQGVALDLLPGDNSILHITANGMRESVPLNALREGPRSFYLGGFLTPAVYLHRAAGREATTAAFTLAHVSESAKRDWYTVRVRQKNGQWAWSSPVWVEGRLSDPG